MELHKKCVICNKLFILRVQKEDYEAWQAGRLIQHVLWYLSKDERELLISGICGKCFDKMLSPEDT